MGSGTSKTSQAQGARISKSADASNSSRPPPQPLQQQEEGTHIVLSYRFSDVGSAKHGGDGTAGNVKRFLESQGYSVFHGESALKFGPHCGQRIDAAVMNCDVVIAICSDRYGQTESTYRELQLADKEHKPIVCVWHSGPYMLPVIRNFLHGSQRVPHGDSPLAQSDFGECMQQVLVCLSRLNCLPESPLSRQNVTTLPRQPLSPLTAQTAIGGNAPAPKSSNVKGVSGNTGTMGPAASKPATMADNDSLVAMKGKTGAISPTHGFSSIPKDGSVGRGMVPILKDGRGLLPILKDGSVGRGIFPILKDGSVARRTSSTMKDGSVGRRTSNVRDGSVGRATRSSTADPNMDLLTASKFGDLATVQRLLAQLTDPVEYLNCKDFQGGLTPLHAASVAGYAAVVEALLEAGADPTVKAQQWGVTPLHVACESGYADVVETLLRAGADACARTRAGNAPLHLASAGGHTAVVVALLKAGADLDAKNQAGDTPLRVATCKRQKAVVDALLREEVNRLMKGSRGSGGSAAAV